MTKMINFNLLIVDNYAKYIFVGAKALQRLNSINYAKDFFYVFVLFFFRFVHRFLVV